jgi:hypothetical protein
MNAAGLTAIRVCAKTYEGRAVVQPRTAAPDGTL